jgi:hypothetical protein
MISSVNIHTVIFTEIYVSKSKIIRTLAITPFYVCHTAFCACMLRVGITVVTSLKFDLDRVIFLAAVTV